MEKRTREGRRDSGEKEEVKRGNYKGRMLKIRRKKGVRNIKEGCSG